jgi:hypothetical protein
MGKRGQGKTTLLHSWLGKSKLRGGLEEILKLPTGDYDTTAALIRLTEAKKHEPKLDSRFLFVDLITKQELPDVTERPGHLAESFIKLQKQVRDEQVEQNAAYRICRFPVERYEDHKLWLDSNGSDGYHVSRDGNESFSIAQWTARQVSIPVELASEKQHGYAAKLLRAVDVIDAPGCDSQQVGELPMWKARKNSYVFQSAIREIDVMLLTCSSDVAAIQLGKQFQDDIWFPWLDRCQGHGDGRLIMAFTKASVLLDEAKKEVAAAEEMGEDEYTKYNVGGGFADKIWANAMAPLAVHTGVTASMITPTDPSTWPPMFFFESEDSKLDTYRDADFKAGNAEAIATNLCNLLDSPSFELEASLPLGQKCILRIARDWNSFSRAQAKKLGPIKMWIVRAFCSLLCPNDAGFRALSECVFNYTTIGPVAINHANERKQDADRLIQTFSSLLSQLGEPSGKEDAVRELINVNQMLQRFWAKYPRGIHLRKGECCARRLDDADANASPLQSEFRPFKVTDVFADIASDTIACLESAQTKYERKECEELERAIVHCLQSDIAVKRILQRHGNAITSHRGPLLRLQAICLERTIRILHFLANAKEEDLREVAMHCYHIDVDEADLIGSVVGEGLSDLSKADKEAFSTVAEAFERLTQRIHKRGFNPAYAVNSTEFPQTN